MTEGLEPGGQVFSVNGVICSITVDVYMGDKISDATGLYKCECFPYSALGTFPIGKKTENTPRRICHG
jgi:hypothetical protein